MQNKSKNIFTDATFSIGVGMILLSLAIFMFPELVTYEKSSDSNFGIFALNYFIAIIFFIIAWIREIPGFKLGFFIKKMEYGFIHLILCLISAFALNREIPIFEQSATWLQWALGILSTSLLGAFVQDKFPTWLKMAYWGFTGIAFSLFLYFSITLIPVYPIGVIASPALGISLHAFVPLWFVLAILAYLLRRDNRQKRNIVAFSTGITFSIAVFILFIIQWNNASRIITRASDKTLLDERNDLPEWTVIAQHLPKNSISEKILKADIVYSVVQEFDDWGFMNLPSRRFDEVKKHDPLVMVATFFFGRPDISEENRIKILESMYDSRHQAQERLWSGDNLETNHVLTNIRLYPSLRISYTEKIITVRNNHKRYSWNPQQEAIYTFHLPEGSVVTSLSLWINGKEEKSILTAKHKADSAYQTIVGVESRDPSLVRWQEGNTVSVRVFPCTPQEDRRFKIGFTSPLCKTDNNLVYENIWFDGPLAQSTDETIKVKTMDNVDEMNLPSGFEEKAIDLWTYEGKYKPEWELTIPSCPIAPNAFTFEGQTYRIKEYDKTFQNFDATDIYLDVNSEWTKAEFNEIRKAAATKKIYVFQNQRILLTDKNADKLFDQLSALNFSLFPLYEISNTQNAILVTKGNTLTPNVSDLGDSDFSKKLKTFLSENKPVKVFNLGNNQSPYLKTLKELRVFEYDSGSSTDFAQLIGKRQFVTNQEDMQNVIINDAGIQITESSDSAKTNAPDHLMRLFSYNNVMFRTGVNFFEKDFYNPEIVDKAYKAYVVSPVTSLVVLETKQDYERFGIKDEGSSLKNASMKSSGAVPEPHEWALIIILAAVAMYLYKKKTSIPLAFLSKQKKS